MDVAHIIYSYSGFVVNFLKGFYCSYFFLFYKGGVCFI